MANLNQSLRDRIVRHELYLKKLANEEVRSVRELVVAAEADIQQQIERRLTWIAERGFDASPFTLRRLEANLREVRAVARVAYREIGGKMKQSLTAVAKSEAEWAAGAVGAELSRVGVELGVGIAEGPLLSAIVNKQPFQGALLKDWTAKLGEDTFHAVRGAVRQGLLQGESIPDIVRRLRGTKANGFKDGILAVRKRNAEAVVRTAVSSVANSAREATWKANDDLVNGVQWISTLDDRTTPQCQVRDGLEYTLDYEPRGHSVPWGDGPGALHWNCRSTSAPILATWRELGINAREVTGEQRAALDGMVPGTQTFGEWLGHMKGQGRFELVEQALGKKRAAAFISGQIGFKDLFNAKGDFLTLAQLQLADPSKLAEVSGALIGPLDELFSTLRVPMNDELRTLRAKMVKSSASRAFRARSAAKAAGLSAAEAEAAATKAAAQFPLIETQRIMDAEAKALAALKPVPPPLPIVKKFVWSIPDNCPYTDELKELRRKMSKSASWRASNARKAAKAAGKTEAEIISAGEAAAADIPAAELAAKAAAEARALGGKALPLPPVVAKKVANLPPAIVAPPKPSTAEMKKFISDAADMTVKMEEEIYEMRRWHSGFAAIRREKAIRAAYRDRFFDALPKGQARLPKILDDALTEASMLSGDHAGTTTTLEKALLHIADPDDREKMTNAFKKVDELYAKLATNPRLNGLPKLRKFVVELDEQYMSRAHANQWRNSMKIGTWKDKIGSLKVIAHEFAHHIEYNNRWIIDDEIKAFLKKRAGNDLSGKVVGGGAGEHGWKDHFAEQYSGKIYGWGSNFDSEGLLKPGLKATDDVFSQMRSTEILTMGMEQMMADPLGFYRSDRDYFEMILRIMTGMK